MNARFNSVSVVALAVEGRKRIGLDLGRFEASIFADNLTDNRAVLFPANFGLTGAVEETPRTVGVNLKAHF